MTSFSYDADFRPSSAFVTSSHDVSADMLRRGKRQNVWEWRLVTEQEKQSRERKQVGAHDSPRVPSWKKLST